MLRWVDLQREYQPFFFIADLHAITVEQDPKVLRERTLRAAAQLVAMGIDPERSAIFVQLRAGINDEVTGTVESLTGSPPRDFATFAREHAQLFAPVAEAVRR